MMIHFDALEMEMVLNIAAFKMEGRYENGYKEIIEQIWTKFANPCIPINCRIKKYEAWARH